MSKIKNGALDKYGDGPFEQQQFRTAGVEGVNSSPDLDFKRDLSSYSWASGLRDCGFRPPKCNDRVITQSPRAVEPPEVTQPKERSELLRDADRKYIEQRERRQKNKEKITDHCR